MKHIILGLALLTGFSALAQCPDPTFDGQTFYQVAYIDTLDWCITEPLVNPDLTPPGDSLTYADALLQEGACPEGYEPMTLDNFNEIVEVLGREFFIVSMDTSNVIVTFFGDTTCYVDASIGAYPFDNPVYYRYTYEWITSAQVGYGCIYTDWDNMLECNYRHGFVYHNGAVREPESRLNCGGLGNAGASNMTGNIEYVSNYHCVANDVEDVVLVPSNYNGYTPNVVVVDYVTVENDNAAQGDINSDGLVGANDLLTLLGNFGLIIQ